MLPILGRFYAFQRPHPSFPNTYNAARLCACQGLVAKGAWAILPAPKRAWSGREFPGIDLKGSCCPKPDDGESLFSGRGFFIRAAAVGNAGFDPLQIAGSPDKLVALRHAEVRHGRLALLAATAVIAGELFHPMLAKFIGAKAVLPEGGLTPSVFNGGLEHPAIALAIAFGTGVMMAVEVIDVKKRIDAGLGFNEWAADSVAGDMQFDPLRFAADLPATERYELQEAEMLNGRLAMVAVLSFVAYETMMAQPVVPALNF